MPSLFFAGPIYFDRNTQLTILLFLLLVYLVLAAAYALFFLLHVALLKKVFSNYYWIKSNGYTKVFLVTLLVTFSCLLTDLFVFKGNQLNTTIGAIVLITTGVYDSVRFHTTYVFILNASSLTINILVLGLFSLRKKADLTPR